MSTRLRSDRDTRRTRRREGLARLAGLSAGPRAKFAVLLGVIGVLFLVCPLAGKVGDVEENGPTAQLPRGAESTQVEEELPAFDADGVVSATVVYVRDGGLTAADRDAVATARTELAEYAANGQVSSPRFSDDGEAASLALGIDTQADGDRTRFEEIRAIADEAPDGLDATVTGPAATLYDVISAFDGIDGRILGASVLVVAVLLLITYRSPTLWLIPLLSVGVAMMLAQAAIYLLGKHADLPVDGQSGGILPILVFGVGTDYALLLIARYREELHLYTDRHTAMRRAIRRAGPAILASSATVVLGLSCLMLADINSTRSLGAVCALGVGFAAIAMVTVLPMLLTLLGRWVFWPFVPRLDEEALAQGVVDADSDTTCWHAGWARIAGVVSRAPRMVWTLTAVALAALAVSTIGLNVGTNDEQKFSTTPDSVTGQQLVTEHFPAGSSAPALVLADGSDAEAVRDAIAGVDGVERVSQPQPSVDGQRVRFEVFLTDAADTSGAESTVDAMRGAVDDAGSDVLVGGPTATTMDIAAAASRDAWLVIPVVLIVVVLVLMALLRAVVGPLVLLGTVLLSYTAALGAGGLLMRAMGFDAVDISLPLLAFVFLVALGVDYTIFLMSRVREEVGRVGHRAGVARGLIATGGVITSAGLVLAATFSVLAVMPIVFMIGLGVVVALGVLLDTFVVRSLLVPALALDIGRRFWAPGRAASPPVEGGRGQPEADLESAVWPM